MRSNLDNNRARGLLIDGPLLLTSEVLAITAAFTMLSGMPHVIALDPASTGRNVTTYTPTDSAIVHKHEIFNISSGTGVLTVLDPTGVTTLGTVAPGQRGEMFWSPKLAAWQLFTQASGQAGETAAAKQVVTLYTTLAGLANSQLLEQTVPFDFILNSVAFRIKIAAATAAKLATLTAQVNGVSVTGGVISLTSANATPSGALVAGTSITAGNVGTAGQTIGVVASAVTAFAEGDGWLEFNLTNTDLKA